jgi:hypothetical protein
MGNRTWADLLSSICERGYVPREARYRPPKHPEFLFMDETIERLFELPEGSVKPCLHVIGGRPFRYGGVSAGV